jgi:hypothetical protein
VIVVSGVEIRNQVVLPGRSVVPEERNEIVWATEKIISLEELMSIN